MISDREHILAAIERHETYVSPFLGPEEDRDELIHANETLIRIKEILT